MLQNMPASVQATQKQSTPAITSEISVGPTSLSGVVPPVGSLSEAQSNVEQKQLSVTGSIDSNMQ